MDMLIEQLRELYGTGRVAAKSFLATTEALV